MTKLIDIFPEKLKKQVERRKKRKRMNPKQLLEYQLKNSRKKIKKLNRKLKTAPKDKKRYIRSLIIQKEKTTVRLIQELQKLI